MAVTKLQRAIQRLRPNLTANETVALAAEIEGYWINDCLEDVLEATEAGPATCHEHGCSGNPEYSGYCYQHRRHN